MVFALCPNSIFRSRTKTAEHLREHATARTRAGAGVADDVQALLLGDLAGSECAVGLERVRDVHVLALVEAHVRAIDLADTGLDRAAIHDDRGTVVADRGHHASGHVLVTARDDNHSVQPMTSSSSLDLIRDEVPRLQGVRHARRPHADTIAANTHLST